MTGPLPRPRIASIDLVRGVAVLSMLAAHFGPDGGIWALSERLTAPLFATLVGVGVLLTWQRRASTGWFFADELYRAAILIALGTVLQQLYWQIDVVLQTLGVLSIVMALLTWLLRGRTVPTVALAVGLAVTSPTVMDHARAWLATGGSGLPLVNRVVELLFAGQAYRVMTFCVFALAGQALLPWVTDPRRRPRALFVGASMLALGTAVGFVVGKYVLGGAESYSGTIGEIVTAVPMTLAVWTGCAWLVAMVPDRPWLTPLLATGRSSLTAYTVQILLARVLVDRVLHGARQATWWMLLTQVLVALLGSMLWQRCLGFGPLEWVMRLPNRWRAGRMPQRARPSPG